MFRRVLFFAGAVLAAFAVWLGGCGRKEEKDDGNGQVVQIPEASASSYGVFLGVDGESFQITDFKDYDIVVVDALELRKEQLAQLHSSGHIVYSYLNVGSVEGSREYYDRFTDLLLDRYENWPEENWIDITDDRWQGFIESECPEMILEKDPDIDGLFLDNLDIYAHLLESKQYREKAGQAFDALLSILEAYGEKEIPVIINGADEFVDRLIDDNNASLIAGVNQETVFTKIVNYEQDEFAPQDEAEKSRLTAYLEKCREAGLEIFLLEYTADPSLAERITQFCQKNAYHCYISEHVDLRGSGE